MKKPILASVLIMTVFASIVLYASFYLDLNGGMPQYRRPETLLSTPYPLITTTSAVPQGTPITSTDSTEAAISSESSDASESSESSAEIE